MQSHSPFLQVIKSQNQWVFSCSSAVLLPKIYLLPNEKRFILPVPRREYLSQGGLLT